MTIHVAFTMRWNKQHLGVYVCTDTGMHVNIMDSKSTDIASAEVCYKDLIHLARIE